MARLRTLLIGGAAVALTAASLAIPAAAADTKGTLAIVNGIPGRKVDVCLNGKEIKSNLGYGGKVFKDVVGVGNKNLKFTEHDPRTCRGHQVGQETFTLDPGEDLTIVVTKNFPKVVTFDNKVPNFLGEIPPAGPVYTGAIFALRDAADLPVIFRYRVWNPDPEGSVGLAADPISTKGQEFANFIGIGVIQLRATLPDDPDTLAVKRAEMGASRRHEWILVGTNPTNMRFVFIDRAISNPSQ